MSLFHKRLRLAGWGLALFLLTLVVGNGFLSADRSVSRNMLGHDFLAFYTAGTFAHQGQFDRLYDLDATKTFQHQLAAREHLEIGQSFGPFWNPPFYAWPFAPLSTLPYHTALLIWVIFNAVCLATAMFLLVRWLPPNTTLGTRLMVPLLVGVSMPCIQALSHGQNTCCSLLLVVLTVHFWRKQPRPEQSFGSDPWLWAGLSCGLLFYKPQLAAVLAMVLILTRGRRALAGVALAGIFLLLTSLLTMPGIIADYLHRLPRNIHFMQVENTYLWERHVTLKAFWRLLFQGRSAGEALPLTTIMTLLCGLALAGGLAYLLWRWLRNPTQRTPLYLDRLIAATIVASPLLMPFYFDYDLLLLAVPATLLATEWLWPSLRTCAAYSPSPCTPLSPSPGTPGEGWGEGSPYFPRSDRWLRISWVLIGICMLTLSSLAGHIRMNLTVPLLAALAIFSIRRTGRETAQSNLQDKISVLRPAA